MIINKLNLLNFGKFKDKKIEFSKGINLIYGNNEAGKSTMHKFIEGMLYGFNTRDSKEGNNSLSDRERFNPWTEECYNGELVYSQNNERIKIYRDFCNNDVRVTDENEIHDLGEQFKYNNKLKVIEPGKTIFGINRRMFSNTFSINQLGSRTDENLVGDVKEKINNLIKSKDEEIKVKNVFNNLNDMKSDFGSIDDSSTRIGEIIMKLSILEDELESREDADGKTSRKLMLVDTYKKQLKKKQIDYDNIENIVGELDSENIKESYKYACLLSEDIEALNDEIGNNEMLDIDMEDYEKSIRIFMKSEQLEAREKELETKVQVLKSSVDRLKEGLIIGNDNMDFEKVNSNYETLQSNKNMEERLENKINVINNEINVFESNHFGIILDSYDRYYVNHKKIKYYKGILESDIISVLKSKINKEKKGIAINYLFALILSVLIAAGAHIAARYFYNNIYYIVLILLVIPALTLKDTIRGKRINKAVKNEIRKIENENIEKLEEKKRLEDENMQVLEETECSNMNDLRTKYNLASTESRSITEKKNTLEMLEEEYAYIKRKNDILENQLIERIGVFGFSELSSDVLKDIRIRIEESREKTGKLTLVNQELESFQTELETVFKDRQYSVDAVKEVLERNDVESVDELKLKINKQRSIKEKVFLRKTKMESLSNTLGKFTLEELKTKIEKLDMLFSNSDYESKEKIIEKHEQNLEEIKELEEKVSNLVANINLKERSQRKLSEITEEMEYFKRKKEVVDQELEVIQKTQSIIEKASQNIQEEFLPKFIRKINYYFSLVTEKKYNEIRLDENLNISVVDPLSNMDISVDSLSAGTIDQIYLSLRFALVDIISKEDDSPVILDDCFTQYDYKRLTNAIDIMENMGKYRQILLFSCQMREKDIFDAKKIPYNYIEI